MFGYCASTMGAGGWFAMVALWGAVLAVAVWAVTRFFPAGSGQDSRSRAVALLDERLASGDIDADTYRRTRNELVDADRR